MMLTNHILDFVKNTFKLVETGNRKQKTDYKSSFDNKLGSYLKQVHKIKGKVKLI